MLTTAIGAVNPYLPARRPTAPQATNCRTTTTYKSRRAWRSADPSVSSSAVVTAQGRRASGVVAREVSHGSYRLAAKPRRHGARKAAEQHIHGSPTGEAPPRHSEGYVLLV